VTIQGEKGILLKIQIFNKVLIAILVVAILGVVGISGYTVAVSKVGERFTEFYILGRSGNAAEYPSVFYMKDNYVVVVQYSDTGTTSEEGFGKVILGIVNHEQQSISYSVDITVEGQPAEINYAGKTLTRLEHIELPKGGKWEQEIGFSPQHSGDNQKVEFQLYKNGETKPENTLHLWVSVKG
jgi:uncharacterized membrane protein